MSFFDKMKASIGIGAAKVDTKLNKGTYSVGEDVVGVVHMVGGDVEQNINGVKLHLMTEVKKESDEKEYLANEVIQTYSVSSSFIIQKGERKEIPFSFVLPENTPITLGQSKVWIHTELDIPLAIDPKDRDYIKVNPSRSVATVLEAMEELGFYLRKVDCEYKRGVIQEFEFSPYSGKFRGHLDEVELVFNQRQNGSLNIHMQVDRKARGLGSLLGEMLELDETNTGLTLNQAEINQGVSAVTQKLDAIISKYASY
jgi:sporulation-control protein